MKNEKLWSPSFEIPLSTGLGDTQNIDFNKLRYYGAPLKKVIISGNAIHANRDSLIKNWYEAFKTANNYRGATKLYRFCTLCQFVKNADEERIEPQSKNAVESWERKQVEMLRLGKYKASTAIKQICSAKQTLKMFGCPVEEWFSSHALMQREPTVVSTYTDKELKTILRILMSLFYQLEKNIISNPKEHISAGTKSPCVAVRLEKQDFKVSAIISKCFSAAAFILCYYTWGNLSSILKLRKPTNINDNEEAWYSNDVHKHRANKIVTLSLGGNSTHNIPKHALSFVKRVINLSKLISPNNPNLLLQARSGVSSNLKGSTVTYLSKWLKNNLNLIDDSGSDLVIKMSKLRCTGSSLYLSLTNNPIETSILLGNTPNVVSRHYSTGNPVDNKKQLVATSVVLEETIRSKGINEGTTHALKKLEIEVLPYQDFLKKYKSKNKPDAQITAIGTGCKNAYGKQQKQYTKGLLFNKTAKLNENLACSDILKCFRCENQVIIEEVDDIWCLLSFRTHLYESQLNHVNNTQFENNYASYLNDINNVIKIIDPKIVIKAREKIYLFGSHPFWSE